MADNIKQKNVYYLAAHFEKRIGVFEFKRGVVFPLVGVANLNDKLIQLLESFFFRFFGKPVVGLKRLFHHIQDSRDHFLDFRLVFFRKKPRDVDLAEELAKPRIDDRNRPLFRAFLGL